MITRIYILSQTITLFTIFFSQIEQKAAGIAEQRARQLDQGPATFESRDENGEVINYLLGPVIRCHLVDLVGSSLAPLIYFL